MPRRPAQPVTPDPAKTPSWQTPSAQSIESAAAEKRPIIIFFEGEKSTDWDLYGDDFAELSRNDALFIKIAYTSNRDKSPWAEESVIPTSKLLSDNPSREYKIPVGKATVLVCDWHGNEFTRRDDKVKAPTLKSDVAKIAKQAESADKSVQRHVDRAKQDIERENQGSAIRNLLNAFNTGYVGYDSITEAARIYHEIMDDLRTKTKNLLEEGDVNGLREVAKIVKKTELEKEVDQAIKDAANVSRKTQK